MKTPKKKPWYKSKELWMALFPLVNAGLEGLGLPAINLTPQFYVAWIGLIGAVRAFFTKTKLTTQ
jgi:hypothetical protein